MDIAQLLNPDNGPQRQSYDKASQHQACQQAGQQANRQSSNAIIQPSTSAKDNRMDLIQLPNSADHNGPRRQPCDMASRHASRASQQSSDAIIQPLIDHSNEPSHNLDTRRKDVKPTP